MHRLCLLPSLLLIVSLCVAIIAWKSRYPRFFPARYSKSLSNRSLVSPSCMMMTVNDDGQEKQQIAASSAGTFGSSAILLRHISMRNRNVLRALVEASSDTKGLPIVVLGSDDMYILVKEAITSEFIAERAKVVPPDVDLPQAYVQDPPTVPIVYFNGLTKAIIKDLMKGLRMNGFKGAFAMTVTGALEKPLGEVFKDISKDWWEQKRG